MPMPISPHLAKCQLKTKKRLVILNFTPSADGVKILMAQRYRKTDLVNLPLCH